MQLFTDASKHDDVIGVGYVLFDDQRYCYKHSYDEELTSMQAELWAIIEGLKTALYHGAEAVTIYTDCDPLAEKIRSNDLTDFTEPFYELTGELDEFYVYNIPREHNDEADRLAKEAAWRKLDAAE